MNRYTDASGLPLAQAIKMLPSFSRIESGKYAQIRTQKSDAAGDIESASVTTVAAEGSPQVIAVEDVWRDLSLSDIIGHESEESCLARTRT